MRITCVAGARPNFMKIAAILAEAARFPDIQCRLVHTGQHYDRNMSDLFFRDLEMAPPQGFLGVGSGSHAAQTGSVMIRFDEDLDANPTDMVLVVGDVNSTLACALVAVKRGVPVAHAEAGLRSGDRTMPEEINRILTDQIADLLLTSERDARGNLTAEGIPESRIHFVGNLMIDTLMRHRERIRQADLWRRLGLVERQYAVCTMHRPSNVDSSPAAELTLEAIEVLASRLQVVFPLHPRTRSRWQQLGLWQRAEAVNGLHLLEPLGYLDFLGLMDRAAVVLTDSGGIQEETTVLGVPCLTFRENTERPVTIHEGTNQLVGRSPARVEQALSKILDGSPPTGRIPELWDGQTARRILELIAAGCPRANC